MALKFNQVDEIRFDLDVKVRYHDRRRAFYDRVHRFIAGITVFAGSAAAVTFWSYLEGEILNPLYGLVAGVLIAVLNAYDLVTGLAARAREHDALYRRYIELDERIVRAKEDREKLKDWEADYLLIERDEPALFKALYVLCHNEAVKVWGLPENEIRRVGRWRTVSAQWWRMSEIEFPRQTPSHGAT